MVPISYLARHAAAELGVADEVVVGDGVALDHEGGPRHFRVLI